MTLREAVFAYISLVREIEQVDEDRKYSPETYFEDGTGDFIRWRRERKNQYRENAQRLADAENAMRQAYVGDERLWPLYLAYVKTGAHDCYKNVGYEMEEALMRLYLATADYFRGIDQDES